MDWFLYDNDSHHKRVKNLDKNDRDFLVNIKTAFIKRFLDYSYFVSDYLLHQL